MKSTEKGNKGNKKIEKQENMEPLETKVEKEGGENILENLTEPQRQFSQFVLDKYIQSGFEELDQDKLAILLQNKFHSLEDAQESLGTVDGIIDLFIGF